MEKKSQIPKFYYGLFYFPYCHSKDGDFIENPFRKKINFWQTGKWMQN